MNILDDYTPEQKQALYTEFIKVWDALPAAIKHTFLREQKCVLCSCCIETVQQVQQAVRADKAAKRLADEQKQ